MTNPKRERGRVLQSVPLPMPSAKRSPSLTLRVGFETASIRLPSVETRPRSVAGCSPNAENIVARFTNPKRERGRVLQSVPLPMPSAKRPPSLTLRVGMAAFPPRQARWGDGFADVENVLHAWLALNSMFAQFKNLGSRVEGKLKRS